MRLAFLIFVLASTAWAKPWNGIDPGSSKKDDVIAKFGVPSRVVKSGNREVLAYLDEKAIKGTKQSQFRIEPGTQLVDRIDVFPAVMIDKDNVEAKYGPACPEEGKPTVTCYRKRITDDFKFTYFHYATLGLAIFFNEDGKTVRSFVFTPIKPRPGPASPGSSE